MIYELLLYRDRYGEWRCRVRVGDKTFFLRDAWLLRRLHRALSD